MRLHDFGNTNRYENTEIEMWLMSAFASEIWQCLKANVRVNIAKGAVLNYWRVGPVLFQRWGLQNFSPS